jgi:hypothetical protein
MVLSYWERAHQYFSFNLKIIQQKYSDTDYSVINNNEIENREKERKRFLDFHYALGGLLLYKGRYNCISRILNFTTSMPPRYELLPASINEILVLYFYFLDPHEVNFPWISSKYYFPELEGIESDYIIKKWISTYFALLLIRHCVLEPMQKASIPPTQGEKRFWINNLNYFKELINNVLETRDLISSLGYEFLNKDWCKENDKSYPPDFIEALRNTIIEKFANAETEQEISSTKITKFQTSTNGILVKCIEKYNNIYNSISIDSDFNSFYINGIMTTNDKSAFAEDQGFEHLNYDSVFANSISNKYKNGISEQFDINKSKSYLIKHDQIFDAIDQLNINSKEFIIVSFGQNIQYYIKNIGVKGLTEHKYKSIDCIHFSECNYQSIGQSLFIIRKTDFPFKIHLEPTQAVRDKYSLTPLNNKYEIYTSVLNLNNEPEILKELTKPNQEKDLKKSVLINIFLSVEMRWKKNINLIQIRSYSEYSERGLPDNLKDVEKFE